MIIDLLPNEILQKIFRKLTQLDLGNVLLVNKKFHYVAFDVLNGWPINHGSYLENDHEILFKLKQVKRITTDCGTNERISQIVIVNKKKNSSLPNEFKEHGADQDSSRKNKSIIVNLLPQFKGVHFVHQDAQFIKKLLTLMFEFCTNVENIAFVDINLTDDHMKYLPDQIVKNLQSLQIIGCERITNDAIKLIGMHCAKLRYLNLRDCFHISDMGLLHIVKNSPNIRGMELTGTCVTNIGICSVSDYCHHLKILIISRCRKLTGEGFGFITEAFKNLEYLNMSANYEGITDKGIQILTRKCNALKHLDISDSSSITDISIFTIADSCKNLTILIAEGCIRVTQQGVIYLVTKCNKLKTLNISGISISDQVLFVIADNCQNLVILNIGTHRNYPWEGIKYVMKKLPHIQILPEYAVDMLRYDNRNRYRHADLNLENI